jgi:hypothetical protein
MNNKIIKKNTAKRKKKKKDLTSMGHYLGPYERNLHPKDLETTSVRQLLCLP